MKTITTLRTWRLKLGNRASEQPITPELAMFLANAEPIFGWYLPTEVVIRNPKQHVVLGQCMYYSAWPEDVRRLTGYTVEQWPDRITTGTACVSNYAYVVQTWEDLGNDGHTDMRLRGYALLTAEDFDIYLAFEHAYSEAYTYEDRLAIEEVQLIAPITYCYSCDTDSATDSWVPDRPGGYPRCPNCTMC